MKKTSADKLFTVSAGKTGSSLMDYSMEIAMLRQLYQNSRVTAEEFQKIKQEIMRSYRITSDLSASNA